MFPFCLIVIVLMIIRMLIIHLMRMVHLLLRGNIGIDGRRILRIVIVVAAVVHRGIRVGIVNWCWRLIKAIEVSFVVIVRVVVHRMGQLLMVIGIVIPLGRLSLWLVLIQGLHMMLLRLLLLIVIPG